MDENFQTTCYCLSRDQTWTLWGFSCAQWKSLASPPEESWYLRRPCRSLTQTYVLWQAAEGSSFLKDEKRVTENIGQARGKAL